MGSLTGQVITDLFNYYTYLAQEEETTQTQQFLSPDG